MSGRRDTPHAVPGAAPPLAGLFEVEGTRLYAELRGEGPAIVIIAGGAEDAETWRPVAERLTDHTVVTYDRRGTLRSGSDEWPGHGSAQHADDAAALIRALDLEEATVFGGSSAGIIALQLALRHPTLPRRALVHEPGFFRAVPGGAAIQEPVNAAVRSHLERHPGDWPGAYDAFSRSVTGSPSSGGRRPLAPPPGMEWYAERERGNAEALVRDDIPILTTEDLDEAALRASEVRFHFSYGTRSMDIFREIVEHLAGVRGEQPEPIEDVGHALCYFPDETAAYIRARS